MLTLNSPCLLNFNMLPMIESDLPTAYVLSRAQQLREAVVGNENLGSRAPSTPVMLIKYVKVKCESKT